MNYKDWLKKYYPIPASEVKGTDLDFIDHCINKWEGLKDLSPYNLRFSYGSVISMRPDNTVLNIDGESCALCEEYYDHDWFEVDDCIEEDDDYPDHPCTKCPLARSLGIPCDGGEDGGVFYRGKKNPQVMIDALKAAREMVVKEFAQNESEDEGFTSDYIISQMDDSDD